MRTAWVACGYLIVFVVNAEGLHSPALTPGPSPSETVPKPGRGERGDKTGADAVTRFFQPSPPVLVRERFPRERVVAQRPGEGFCSDKPSPSRFSFTSVHMGTEWRIVLFAPDQDTAEKAKTAAFDRVAALDTTMTDYDPKSELMRLCATNDAAPGKPVVVSDDLFRVLAHAQEVSAECDGAFDVTVGPLVKLWRAARKSKQLPSAKELAAAKALVGFKMLTLDAKAKTVTLRKAGMRLDLGGIGKGFAADEAMAVLKKHGVTSALIAASGDITVSDAPPDSGAKAWVVEIAPIGKGEPARFLKLANASVSTSGDLFQFVEIANVRYSHVLDPKTGLGLTGRRSATVIAGTGWRADAMTKAASVLSPEKAVKWIDARKDAATFIVVKDTNEAKPVKSESSRFKQFVAEE